MPGEPREPRETNKVFPSPAREVDENVDTSLESLGMSTDGSEEKLRS
jgi:hypothetical protein